MGLGDFGGGDDGGFGGVDSLGMDGTLGMESDDSSSGYGGYGGFAGGGSAAGISGNEQGIGMGDSAGEPGDGGLGGFGNGEDASLGFGIDTLNPAHLNAVVAGLGMAETGTAFSGYADMGFMAGTSFSQTVNGVTYGYSFGVNTFSENQVTGWFDNSLDKMYARAYGINTPTVEGGTIASHLLGLGLSPTEAITAEAIAKVGIGILLGASTVSIGLSVAKGLTQVLGVTGTISKQEFDNINMAIGIAGAMVGLMHTMETISTVTSFYSYTNTTQKALAIAVIALSIKNNINTFQAISEKYGVTPSEINIADIASIDFDSDILVTNYEKLIKIKAVKYNLVYGKRPNEWEVVDRMAGSVMFDMFMAGGNFSADQDFSQLKASVGGNYILSN